MRKSRNIHSQNNFTKPTSQWLLLGCLVTLSCLIKATVGLDCFQCVSTSGDGGDCRVNHEKLINATKKNAKKDPTAFLKDCTGSSSTFNRCFIEYHLGPEDVYLFYHRGCHDGVTFNQKVYSPRFVNLTANNETTCAKPPGLVNTVVCFRFCDRDLCNGPPGPEPDPCANASDTNATTADGFPCGVNGFHGNAWLGVLLSLVVTSASIRFMRHSFIIIMKA